MPRKPIKDTPAPEAWKPAPWDLPDAAALQALNRGEATPEQQARAIKFVVEGLARTYDLSFRPSGDRETAFAEGSRFVGLQIVKLLHLNLAKFRTDETPSEQG